jgi:hypothetical protein
MRNAITMNASRRWRAPSTLAALSLAAFLAAGCTTNKVPGNGQPSSSPEIGSAGTAATPGSSSGTSGTPTTPANPPMISTSANAGAAATPDIEPHTARVLGPANPGPETGPAEQQAQQATGPYQNSAALANPQRTVNSSISSPATPAIVSGVGDLAAATTALRDAAIASGATPEQLAIIGGTSGAVAPTTLNTVTSGNVTASSTGMSATPSTAGATMGGDVSATPLPIATSAVPLTPNAASVGAAPTTAASPSAPSTPSRVSSAPVQVTTSSNGTVTVTNPTTQGQSRFQRILLAMHLTTSQAAPSDQKP